MTKRLKEAVKQAEEASAGITDPELKKIAFGQVLSHLLAGGSERLTPAADPETAPRRRVATSSKTKVAPAKKGPKAWLEQLLADGFFKKPKTMSEILEALAERNHHLTSSGITRQLKMLQDEEKLRRKRGKAEKGKKRPWEYSEW